MVPHPPTDTPMHTISRILSLSTLSVLTTAAVVGQSAVDLNAWNAESYPSVSGFGAGVWNVATGGGSVTQTVNGQPTLFYSDFTAFNTAVEGQITPAGGDDDYIGFALGFMPGDSTNPAADYLLVDWKAGTQAYNFGSPSCTPGSTAPRGLAISRVRGVPTADEFWGHTDFDDPACSPLGQGLTELARGTNLGATQWSGGTTYTFRFEFTAISIRVFVDGVLEMDVPGNYANGRMAFYNFSQANVTYNAFTLSCLANWANYGTGWAGTSGVPALTLSAPPVIGTSVDIQMGNALGASTNACFIYGFNQVANPSMFGGTWLSESLGVVPFHPIPAGGLNYTYAIPNDLALCGVQMYAQLVHEDAGATAGVAFSEGLSVFFGL